MICYAQVARDILVASGGQMTDEDRQTYYRKCLKGIYREDREIIARVIASKEAGEPISATEMIGVLEARHAGQAADALFEDLLYRGVLSDREDGSFHVPIPSFHIWIVTHFGPGVGLPLNKASRWAQEQ